MSKSTQPALSAQTVVDTGDPPAGALTIPDSDLSHTLAGADTYTLTSVTVKVTVVHMVTYFVIGLLAFTFFDYAAKYADPVVSNFMRQTSDPWVAAGPLFQVVRGVLFGLIVYLLRDVFLMRRHGWLYLWLVLVVVGVLSPFGAAPSSIEGVLYTNLPLWFHLAGLPEVLLQPLALAVLATYWINHPEKRWLSIALWAALLLVVTMATLGVLSGLGMLPTP